MIYLSYNNDYMHDGFGAQLQRIIYIYKMSKILNVDYLHTNIITREHGFTEEILNKFNHLIEFKSVHSHSIYKGNIIYIDKFDNDIYNYISNYTETNQEPIIFKINNMHTFFDLNPHLLISTCDLPIFSWVFDNNHKSTIISIAIHIRRGDVSPHQNPSRFLNFEYYLQCIINISKILQDTDYKITIYSENSILNELNNYINILNNIKNINYNIDGDVIDIFKDFVNSDILITSKSSYSYSAALIKKRGITLYPSFWHTYPSTAICIDEPNTILYNKDKIMESIQIVDKLHYK